MNTWVEDGVIYKTRGPEVIAFIEKYCLNPKTEKPLKLDDDQKAFLNEFYLMYWDEDERQWFYVYKNALRGEPRGMGKSTLSAAAALFELSPLSGNKSPQVQLASATRGNTKYVFNPARAMIDLNPAFEREFRMFGNKNALWCDANNGYVEKLSGDGHGQFGGEPIFIVRDELHAWQTDTQILLSEALMTSLGKSLVNARCWTNSTAGSDKNTLLGKLYDQALKHPDLQQVNPGLKVLKDRENAFLFWWWEAPQDMAIDDPATWRICNRAERKDDRQLRTQFNDPNSTQDEFRRQYLNQWTKAEHAWFQVGVWRALATPGFEIPEGGRIQVAIDGGWSDDMTACVWGYATEEDEPIFLDARIWAYNEGHRALGAYTDWVPGGTMDMALVKDFILNGLAQRYTITEVVYDPKYFDQTAKEISRESGLNVPPFPRTGAVMQQATSDFYNGVMNKLITHNGNPQFAQHIEATQGKKLESGWLIEKLKQSKSHKIDACIAAVMAHSRAKADLTIRNQQFSTIFVRRTDEDGKKGALKSA